MEVMAGGTLTMRVSHCSSHMTFVLPKAKKKIISFEGVQLWDTVNLKPKQCTSFVVFKRLFCAIILGDDAC